MVLFLFRVNLRAMECSKIIQSFHPDKATTSELLGSFAESLGKRG
jgi:hypothetical protein